MSTDRITEYSSLFDSDDDDAGEDIFNTTESPRKEKKVVTQENDPFLNILDSEATNLSPYLTPSTQSPIEVADVSDDLGSQNIADYSEDFEKQLVAEKARSATYNALNNELYEKLESVELDLEQTKFDYATSQEKLSSKLDEESQWNLQKEALKTQLRISQDENQKLKTENQELGLKSQMENDTASDPVPALEKELNTALADKENTVKNLQKTETTLSNLRKEKNAQDNYIADLKSELAEKNVTISQLEQKVSVSRDNISGEDMSSTIKKLEKSISLKDQKISELEDLAVIARRSKRQEQEMKLQEEKIITLERKIEFLQNQDRLRNRSPNEDRIPSPPQVELVPKSVEPVSEPEPVKTAGAPVGPPPVKSSPEPVEPDVQQTQASLYKKSAPVTMETPKISIDTSKLVNSALPPRETQNKTAVIVDRQTGKSLRTATLEERMKKFRGSAENIANDETSATKHTFRRVSSSGSTRSTPSPDMVRASSQPVSPDIKEQEIKINPTQSLPPDAIDAQKAAKVPYKKTYSPLPYRAKIDVDPDICISCGRRAYPIEKITVDKMPYHKFCFKCIICKSILRPGKHASYEGTIYCLNHFKQEFLGGGGKYPGQVRYF